VKITKTFELTPTCKDSVWYIQWAILGTAEDESGKAAWNRFAAKKRAGKDAHGNYYDSRKHANDVIREFKQGRKAASIKRGQRARSQVQG